MAWVPVEIKTAGKIHRVDFSTDLYVVADNKWFSAFAIRRYETTRDVPNEISHYGWNPTTWKDRAIDYGAGLAFTTAGGILGGARAIVGVGAANLIGSQAFPLHNLIARLRGARTTDQYYEVESGLPSIAFPSKIYLRDVTPAQEMNG